MHFLPKEIGLETEQDLSSLDFAKIEALCSHFFGSCHNRIDVRADIFAEFVGLVNDFIENFLLFGLEGQVLDLIPPVNQVLKLGPSCISRYLYPVITNWASVVIILFYFAASNFETFAVIPRKMSVPALVSITK